jgi:uncharacterized protein involved in exopolysaccharide biosynthesis/Mrp family chromosome partitioning ATPase
MTAGMTNFEKLSRSLVRQPPPPPVQLRDDELDVLAVFRLIRRRILLILLVGFLLTAAALPSILSMEKVYFAHSRLLIQMPLTTSLAAPPTERLGELDLNTELQRVSARDIAVRVIHEFDLAEREEFNPELRREPLLGRARAAVRGWIVGEELEEPEGSLMDQVIAEFLARLSVQRSGQSEVVEIGFLSQDPELAAAVANALVRIYLEERDESLRQRVDAADRWLAGRIAEQRARVSKASLAIKEFRESTGLASRDAQTDAARTISTLTARHAEITTSRAELAATLAGFEAVRGKPEAAEAVDSETMAELQRELQVGTRELAMLLETYGDNFGGVVDARAQVDEIEAAIAGEVERHIQSLRTSAAALEREEQAVLAGLDTARATLRRVEALETEMRGLQRTAEREQKALEELEQQRRALQRQGELPVAEVEVLSPAAVPLYPEGRSRLIYLLAAMVAAGGVALTAAFVREMLDNGVRSPQQLEGIAGIVPAGMVPKLSIRGAPNLPDLVRLQPGGMFADTIRGLVLSLERVGNGNLPGSLTVTSALPGEGKSLIAASIAVELAAAGRRVLLVDGDLRLGKVHGFFGGNAEPGLADFLCGVRGLDDVTCHDEDTGVDYIPRGSLRLVPFHEQQNVARLIEHARKADQIVIFDSAPILATTETSVLAGLSERTVLVVRWGRTPRRTVELAVQKLLSATHEEIAVAINMVNPRRHALYGFKDAGLFQPELRKYYPGAA